MALMNVYQVSGISNSVVGNNGVSFLCVYLLAVIEPLFYTLSRNIGIFGIYG